MGVDLVWRNTAGAVVQMVSDEPSLLLEAIERVREDRARAGLLIAGIDPYGTTRFMAGQAGLLLREFEELRNETGDADIRIAIGRILPILRATEGSPNDWLEFVGD